VPFHVALRCIASRGAWWDRDGNWLQDCAFVENKGPNWLRFVIFVLGSTWPRAALSGFGRAGLQDVAFVRFLSAFLCGDRMDTLVCGAALRTRRNSSTVATGFEGNNWQFAIVFMGIAVDVHA
jgi:hypothetical protein